MAEVPTSASVAVSTLERHGVVVHYHEIGLKGRNRGFFERRLVRNLTDAIEGCPNAGVHVFRGRLLVATPGAPSTRLLHRVGTTFGVATYAPCEIVGADLEALRGAALRLLEREPFSTFGVAARRATKESALTSRDINVQLGAAIQHATGASVNLDAPDALVHVEVVGRQAMVYVDRRTGPGGLPVGVSGRVVSLLSGGIDSPVATYRILRRGAQAVLCHFHSAPFTDRSSARKAEELAQMIADWQGDTTLYQVPIGSAQQQIVVVAPPALRVVLYRRLMVRIAAAVAQRERAKALVTGDSLGQVASQTMDNMICVDEASPLPVLRPLVGDDKQDIVDEAKRIGTYDLSIIPYEDCCSLFVPRSPATKADVQACLRAEAELDMDAMIAACLEETEVVGVQRSSCADEDGG